ncbi:hypothetical protein COCOBI_18-1150 [Coccomyxa sp. Obi]|nr:hypothetical protein COCOBI_05-5450 [Coccomyxa sp. Obi]BDA45662.1 hypothetical protein COCOBI_07-4490 [Coccomyxa sp. Obi]BDA51238.1 hypothetical protein COCOBI_18-1150 [Coccomyxa sp. Obi]
MDRSLNISRGTDSGSTASAMKGLQNAIKNAKAPRKQLKRLFPTPAGDSGDGGKMACTWSSEEELTVMKHLKKVQEKDTMGSGEVKYGPIAAAMNELYHAVDPVKYREKDWRQIKAKDNNMRAKFKEIVRTMNKEVRARKQTTGAATDDDGNPVQEGDEQDPTWVRPAPVLTDEDMGVEEMEQGQAKWENFQEYYDIFHEDPSLMDSLAREVGSGRPIARAGNKSGAAAPALRGVGLFDGLAEDSEEGSSEQSTGAANKKARTPKTPGASRLSKPDHSFSQLMHRLEESERHQAAADAREEAHRKQQMDMHSQEMRAHREDTQMRNQLFMMQMQQQAQHSQNLLAAIMRLGAGNAGAQPLAPVAMPTLPTFGAAPPCPTGSAPTTTIPTPQPAPGGSGLNAPPVRAAQGVVHVDPPHSASTSVPAVVPVTAPANSISAGAAAATIGAAVAVAVAGTVHARSAGTEGESGSVPDGAQINLPEDEEAQRMKRSSKPNPRYG